MLTGQAKLDYQRAYMRRRRSNARTEEWKRSNEPPVSEPELVRPKVLDPVRPKCTSDSQSHNPMMVGYVPGVVK